MDLSEYRALFDLTGKTAVVIGAGSGIGRAGAEAMAAHGADVICGDLSGDAATAVADRINEQGGKARSAVVDLGDGASIDRLYDSVERIDIMVTTPAINVRKRLLDVTVEEFERVVALNLIGNFRAVKGAGARMAEQGAGSIVVVSSIGSQVVEPGPGVCAATTGGRGYATGEWCRWRCERRDCLCRSTASTCARRRCASRWRRARGGWWCRAACAVGWSGVGRQRNTR